VIDDAVIMDRHDYEAGHHDGYRRGDLERQALAIANSNLRSDLLRLRTLLSDIVASQRYAYHGQRDDAFSALLPAIRKELEQ